MDVVQREGFGVPAWQGDLDLPQKADVRVNDTCAVMVDVGETVELRPMRWSFIPARPGGPPVFNFRSEGRSFGNSRRCLVPCSTFFEFTTPEDPKQKRKDKWRFARNDGDWMAMAGLWRPAEGNQPATFTLLTCDAGPDIAPIHRRQIIPLGPGDWRAWLTLSRPEAELLRPLSLGTFSYAKAS